ncbi:MAG TPA: hypothetical protein DIT65_02915 [Cryomorphaceae bacterium]|nr:hypothetical protein [Cryomorphaceae bacterium]
MGAVHYVQNWITFLGQYDHWRFLFAELNKIMYLRSYTQTLNEMEKEQCLQHAAQWLIHSQEQGSTDGCGTYYFTCGWTSDYPETTGYIIPSLLRYAAYEKAQWSEQAIKSALEAGEWLLTLQREDGGWPGGYIEQNRPSVVFNSGQILRGMLALYTYNQDLRWKGAAERCIGWIWQQLDEQGRFATNDYMGAIRVYGTYVVAPILDWLPHFNQHREAWHVLANRHLNWVCTQQNKVGWFANCDNTQHKNDKPIIHTIAYTIDGIWNSGVALNNEAFKASALVPARVLAMDFLTRGILNGRYTSTWAGTEAFIPTGGAQLAIVWHSMYKETGDALWKEAFEKMNTLLCVIARRGARQFKDSLGALPGSFPMWGRYEPFGLPNWATKYFLDTLLNER